MDMIARDVRECSQKLRGWKAVHIQGPFELGELLSEEGTRKKSTDREGGNGLGMYTGIELATISIMKIYLQELEVDNAHISCKIITSKKATKCL